jgi:hypothetical protein
MLEWTIFYIVLFLLGGASLIMLARWIMYQRRLGD